MPITRVDYNPAAIKNRLDFVGIYKYKVMLLAILLVIWVYIPVSFFHPALLSYLETVNVGLLILMAVKMAASLKNAVVGYQKANAIMDRMEGKTPKRQIQHRVQLSKLVHVFIIPSYRQELEVFYDTLDRLASHSRAKKQYFVCFAMEEREEFSSNKAQALIAKYSSSFRFMDYTVHQLQSFEQQGKSSNVNYCGERLQQKFVALGVDPEQVLLTIIDVDSWVPEVYFDEVEYYLDSRIQQRNRLMFAPVQMFSRNNGDVPVFTRVQDQNHGLVNFFWSGSFWNVGFPLSNYTVSFAKMKEIGFWDTCPDAIGEDFHTTLKAFWKSKESIEVVPIYAMFNQLCVQTGKGYLQDCLARFWQAERHARGISSVCYAFNLFWTHPMTKRTAWLTLLILEGYVGMLLFWMGLGFKLHELFGESVQKQQNIALTCLIIFLAWSNHICYLIYLIVKRRAARVIYGEKPENGVVLYLQYVVVYSFNILFYVAVPFVMALFNNIKNENRFYRVAEKKTSKIGKKE